MHAHSKNVLKGCAVTLLLYSVTKLVFQMPVEYFAENREHGHVVERVYHDDVEMTTKPGRDCVAGGRRAHGAQ